jgi:hypothetical protein
MFQFKNRIYLVNREFQLRYTRVALAVGLVSTVMTVGLILYPLFYLDIVRFPYFVPAPFMVGMTLAAVLNFAFVTAFGIVTTHRIAGPMFSLVRHLHLIQLGQKPTELRVREGDDLKFVVRNVNEFLDFVNQRTAADVTKLDEILATLASDDGSVKAVSLVRELRLELEQRLAHQES